MKLAMNIALLDALREDRSVCHFDDAWVLKEIEKTPMRDQVGDFRIASQRDNLWMLGQFARTGKRQKFLRAFGIGKDAPGFLQRCVGSLPNWISVLKHASE